MKIDSIKNFGYALFHPFSKKIDESLVTRIAIGVLSTLLIVPMAYAGYSLLKGRCTQKNPNNLNQTDNKAQKVAQSHTQSHPSTKRPLPPSNTHSAHSTKQTDQNNPNPNPQIPNPLNFSSTTPQTENVSSKDSKKKPVNNKDAEQVIKAFQSGSKWSRLSALDDLSNNIGLSRVLEGLTCIKPSSIEDEENLNDFYSIFIPKEASTADILTGIDGLSRLKNVTASKNYFALMQLVSKQASKNVNIEQLTKKILEFHQIMSQVHSQEALSEWIGACASMIFGGYAFPELRSWALDQLINIQNLSDKDCDALIEWFGRIVTTYDKTDLGERPIVGYVSAFKTMMAKPNLEKREELQDKFFSYMKSAITILSREKDPIFRECLGVLLVELKTLEKDYPKQVALLIQKK